MFPSGRLQQKRYNIFANKIEIGSKDTNLQTVYPFCTSASSGLGSSADDLASEAGSGDWKDGQRFSSGVTQQDVADWISGLGLGQ